MNPMEKHEGSKGSGPVIRFTLGKLPADLSPNRARRLHWGMRSRAAKAVRTESYISVRAAMPKQGFLTSAPQWKKAIVRLTFYFTLQRNRDADNLIAQAKPVFDGLEDAGVIENDRGLTPLPPVIVVDKNERERVEVEVWEDEARD